MCPAGNEQDSAPRLCPGALEPPGCGTGILPDPREKEKKAKKRAKKAKKEGRGGREVGMNKRPGLKKRRRREFRKKGRKGERASQSAT